MEIIIRVDDTSPVRGVVIERVEEDADPARVVEQPARSFSGMLGLLKVLEDLLGVT